MTEKHKGPELPQVNGTQGNQVTKGLAGETVETLKITNRKELVEELNKLITDHNQNILSDKNSPILLVSLEEIDDNEIFYEQISDLLSLICGPYSKNYNEKILNFMTLYSIQNGCIFGIDLDEISFLGTVACEYNIKYFEKGLKLGLDIFSISLKYDLFDGMDNEREGKENLWIIIDKLYNLGYFKNRERLNVLIKFINHGINLLDFNLSICILRKILKDYLSETLIIFSESDKLGEEQLFSKIFWELFSPQSVKIELAKIRKLYYTLCDETATNWY